MRLSREELLKQYPIWNESNHNIVKIMYGDEPLVHYDKNEYLKYHNFWSKDKTCANIMAVDAYIYSQNGTYDKYRTLLGEVYIDENDNILCGDISIKYGGMTYDIIINNMYGFHALTILRLSGSGKVLGFSNKDGQGSPAIKSRTDELKNDLICKVLDIKRIEDYGDSIHNFIQCAFNTYNKNKINYIMNKCFSM